MVIYNYNKRKELIQMKKWRTELIDRVIKMFGYEDKKTILLVDFIEKCFDEQKQYVTELVEMVEDNYRRGMYFEEK